MADHSLLICDLFNKINSVCTLIQVNFLPGYLKHDVSRFGSRER